MNSTCIVYVGKHNNINRGLVKCFNEVRRSNVYRFLIFILTDEGMQYVIPQIRSIMLNNIYYSIRLYSFTFSELNHLTVELVHNIKNMKITSICICSDSYGSRYLNKLEELIKKTPKDVWADGIVVFNNILADLYEKGFDAVSGYDSFVTTYFSLLNKKERQKFTDLMTDTMAKKGVKDADFTLYLASIYIKRGKKGNIYFFGRGNLR